MLLALLAPASGLGVAGCERPRGTALDVGWTLLDGRREQLAELRGQVVLVNFWATTCAVCVAEMPTIVATQQRYGARGLQTVAVAMRHDPPAAVALFAERRALPLRVVIDNTGEVARTLGPVEATPTLLLLDRAGRTVQRSVGRPDFAALHARIEALLAEPAA